MASHTWKVKSKFGFSAFVSVIFSSLRSRSQSTLCKPYELMRAYKEGLDAFGPLNFYKGDSVFFKLSLDSNSFVLTIAEHERGGHFPALDSPKEFVEDLREFFAKNFN